MTIAILIPAFNEEGSIAQLVREIKALHLSDLKVVVINDGSRDETARRAHIAGADFVLDLPINLGIGGAVQTGYRFALAMGFDWAVQMDGDGQHDPKDLPALVKAAQTATADLVIGSRFVGAGSEMGFQSTALRRLGIRWFSGFIRFLTGTRICDPTSGYRLASRRLFNRFADHYPADYPEPETLAWTLSAGFKVSECPVTMRSRTHGSSSINLRRSVYYMIKVSLGILVGLAEGKGYK